MDNNTPIGFNNIIAKLKKQIKELSKLRPLLKIKEKELEESEKTFEKRVNVRTAAERIIHRQLHGEIKHYEKIEKSLEIALEYANGIINTIRDPLVVLDSDLSVVSASPAFYHMFDVRPEETENKRIYDLGNRQWNIPKLRKLLEDILSEVTHFDSFEVEHIFPVIGKRTMLLNARKICFKTTARELILLAIEDITERKEMQEKLKQLAAYDELTGCLNFRSIMEILASEIARAARYHTKFSIIMIDIDYFKKINDEHGHLAGNDVMSAFADVVKKNTRVVDRVGRYGGDEFIIILPETDGEQALVVVEKIRKVLKRTKVTSSHSDNKKKIVLNFSAGIAGYPKQAKDIKELLHVADNALLHVKREGKNSVVEI